MILAPGQFTSLSTEYLLGYLHVTLHGHLENKELYDLVIWVSVTSKLSYS